MARELETTRARAAGGEMREQPTGGAELAGLRVRATDLSTRKIAERLFLSPNAIRSHTRKPSS